jgi:hypothetical protein
MCMTPTNPSSNPTPPPLEAWAIRGRQSGDLILCRNCGKPLREVKVLPLGTAVAIWTCAETGCGPRSR